MKLGLREANQRFSMAIKAVRQGEEVVLTDRGQPVAIITPVRRGGVSATLDRLAQAGLIRRPQKRGRLPRAQPVAARGVLLSRLISGERDQR